MQRGQISHLPEAPWCPARPVAGEGYAIADGMGGLWCGATTQDADPDPKLRAHARAHGWRIRDYRTGRKAARAGLLVGSAATGAAVAGTFVRRQVRRRLS